MNVILHLHDTNISKLFNSIIEEYLDDLIDNYTNGSGNIKDVDWDDFCIEVLDTFGIDIASIESKINTKDDFINHISQQKDSILNYKNESLPEGIFENFQKVMIFTAIDHKWRQHLYSMDQLEVEFNCVLMAKKILLLNIRKKDFPCFKK